MIGQHSLEMEKAVKSSSDFLLLQLEELKSYLDDLIPVGSQNQGIGKSQVQNLLRAAQTASGIPEMKLYVQYQMGRDERRQGWAKVSAGRKFGERMIAALENIEARAKSLAEAGPGTALQTAIGLRLAERFFVYLQWHFTYAQSVKMQAQQKHRGESGDRPAYAKKPSRGVKK